MRFRTLVATCAVSLSLASVASADSVLFDSLGGETSSAAFAGGIDPVMSATFNTGAASVRVDVSLLLRAGLPELGAPSDTFTVSLDGGIPLSDLAFDPLGGLDYSNGSSVDLQGPVIKSVSLPVTALQASWSVDRYDQFADVVLNPNSLYWIEVNVTGQSEVEWGMTADLSGSGVSSNYLAWSFTNDGLFLNKGVDPFPFNNALQMEVDPVPELSTWAMMLMGFAGLGFAGWRETRTIASSGA